MRKNKMGRDLVYLLKDFVKLQQKYYRNQDLTRYDKCLIDVLDEYSYLLSLKKEYSKKLYISY